MFFRSKSGPPSWLVAFLGNPGQKYAQTRHNAGFMAAAALEEKEGLKINRIKFKALTCLGQVAGEPAFLMMPQTYMNLSGEAVAQATAFYKIPPERVLVVVDDIALPAGKLRIRRSGSAGGHNGLKSIIQELGTDAFPRIKIGVGQPPHPDYDIIDWVIGRLSGKELEAVQAAARRAAEAVGTVLTDGVEQAMNRYNGN